MDTDKIKFEDVELADNIFFSNKIKSDIETKFALKLFFRFLKKNGVWNEFKKYAINKTKRIKYDDKDANQCFHRIKNNILTDYIIKYNVDMFLLSSVDIDGDSYVKWDDIDELWCDLLRYKFGFDF